MIRETVRKSLQDIVLCENCKIGFSVYIACFGSRNVELNKGYKTCLELTPCDFVALLLDPNEQKHLKSGSDFDLIRDCFHQCLALFGNGVSEHILEIILGYNLISQKGIEYIL